MNTEMENIIEEIKAFYKNNPNPQLEDYKKQVELYKKPATDWKKEVRKNFLKHFEVASTGQSRFTNDTIDKLSQDNVWSFFTKEIDNIIDSTENNLIQNCINLENVFVKGIKDKKINNIQISQKTIPQLAIRAMICSLRPRHLCRIVKEDCLDYLYKYINKKITSGKDKQNVTDEINTKWENVQQAWEKSKKDSSWYNKSYAIANFFNTVLKEENKDKNNFLDFAAVPWDYYEEVSVMDQLAKKVLLQKNIILTGAPGTGKTYLANQIAEKIISKETQTGNGINKQKEYRKTHIKFVQFHPSYDYTDFVEGLRPQKGMTGRTFERVDGTFKAFCKNAVQNLDEDFVFIIDEINRGEISKILGELFFSIDPGYRVEKEKIQSFLANNGDLGKDEDFIRVDTQYQNLIEEDNDVFKDGFYVPENVYIIGTMNDIDRSVESMDFAFRRRFAFHDVKAKNSQAMLYQLDENVNETIKKMDALNKALVSDKCGLTTAYQIGGAYFLKLKDVDYDFGRLWDEYLYGVLFEYFRGEPDAENKMKILKTAYDGKTEQDSEKDNQEKK